jgi:hypothetical protein
MSDPAEQDAATRRFAAWPRWELGLRYMQNGYPVINGWIPARQPN